AADGQHHLAARARLAAQGVQRFPPLGKREPVGHQEAQLEQARVEQRDHLAPGGRGVPEAAPDAQVVVDDVVHRDRGGRAVGPPRPGAGAPARPAAPPRRAAPSADRPASVLPAASTTRSYPVPAARPSVSNLAAPALAASAAWPSRRPSTTISAGDQSASSRT